MMKILLSIRTLITATQVFCVLGNCTFGRPGLEETSPSLTAGTYIDITRVSPCSGQITKWNFCYYNPNNGTSSGFLVNFQVWRFSPDQNATLAGETVTTVEIPQRSENFQCDDIILSTENYINVTEGDYLGVRLSTHTLPVVANSDKEGEILLFLPVSLNVINLESNIQIRAFHALHVTAEIATESVSISTETERNNLSLVTTNIETSMGSSSMTTSSEGLPVIPIISSVSAAIFILILMTSIAFCILICKKDKKSETPETISSNTPLATHYIEMEDSNRIEDDGYDRISNWVREEASSDLAIETVPNFAYSTCGNIRSSIHSDREYAEINI